MATATIGGGVRGAGGATIRSNLADVAAALRALPHLLDLDGPGPAGGGTLADDLIDTYLRRLADRTARQQAPDGSTWAPNREPYASSPRKRGKPPGILSGDMLSLEQMIGERWARRTEARWRYGRTAFALRKAIWFGRGVPARNQVARPIFGLTSDDESELDRVIRARVERSGTGVVL